MNLKKMLVLDLDGTLTNSEKIITPITKERIMEIQKQGHTVVLASGRPTPGVIPLAKQLELSRYGGYMLCFNGGEITDCKENKVVYEQTLPEEIVPELFQMAEELKVGLMTYEKEMILSREEPDEYVKEEMRITNLPYRLIGELDQYKGISFHKCLGTANPSIAPEIELKFAQRFGDRLSVGRSEPFFIEITPLGIDKAASLGRLIEITGHSREDVIACGDGFNDKSMIEFAGIGVAMANAQEAVKEVADYVTASNEEDGVAQAIDKFILEL